jgi:uncharacterized protein (DUF39 family)
MTKTIEEINERIRRREAVVVTAEEMTGLVAREGVRGAARRVDVVTTGTFGAMCSSGALLNVGHASPRIKIRRAWLNGVPVQSGLAAVDLFLGATQPAETGGQPEGRPVRYRYGGGHVISDLVRGRAIHLRAEGYGTDCYPRRNWERVIDLASLPQATLLNARNAYQNYNVAVNAGRERTIYTYMGVLPPSLAEATYSSAGQLSPLLNDPYYRTIGIGTRIFLGGGIGYVCFHGTQHAPEVPRNQRGIPLGGAGTLAVIGDLKGMDPCFLRGLSLFGYGVSLAVGIGVPIPILDEEMAAFTSVSDADITAPVVDYSRDYPEGEGEPLTHVSYAELRSGAIRIGGRDVRTRALSSYPMARRIAETLQEWIRSGRFLLTRPAAPLPGSDHPGSGAVGSR